MPVFSMPAAAEIHTRIADIEALQPVCLIDRDAAERRLHIGGIGTAAALLRDLRMNRENTAPEIGAACIFHSGKRLQTAL